MIGWTIAAILYALGMIQASLIVKLTKHRIEHSALSVVLWPYPMFVGMVIAVIEIIKDPDQ